MKTRVQIKNKSTLIRFFLIVGCIAVAAAAGRFGYGMINLAGGDRPAAAVPGEEDCVFRNGDTDQKRMSITCNVDWGEEVIPDILEILQEKNVRITFFVSGRWAENHPDLIRRMYLCGHEIQSHGYGHKLSTKISKEQEQEEIQKTEEAIFQILGEKPTIYAPPSGDYDQDTVALCRELGYKLSLWSADTIDWRQGSTADVITERILKKPLKGAIMLMHPKPETVKALPGIIEKISQEKIEMVPVGELLAG